MNKNTALTITDVDTHEKKKNCADSNKQTGEQTGHEQWTRSTNTVIMQTVAAHVLTNKKQQQYVKMLEKKTWITK